MPVYVDRMGETELASSEFTGLKKLSAAIPVFVKGSDSKETDVKVDLSTYQSPTPVALDKDNKDFIFIKPYGNDMSSRIVVYASEKISMTILGVTAVHSDGTSHKLSNYGSTSSSDLGYGKILCG